MASNQSEMLLKLNTIDASILEKEKAVKESAQTLEVVKGQVSKKTASLDTMKKDLQRAKDLHATEEKRLKEEEVKIVERRKQLTSLGGAKSAKLVERELDIAKRIMETLEQSAFQALESAETLGKKEEVLSAEVDELKSRFEKAQSDFESISTATEKELENLKKERKDIIVTLDARLQVLYKRVESRYRGDAIALAESGSCRSCFRALPAQTFNQVIAGYNLIQCPGCSRILVHIPSQEVANA